MRSVHHLVQQIRGIHPENLSPSYEGIFQNSLQRGYYTELEHRFSTS